MDVYQNPIQNVEEIPTYKREVFRVSRAIANQNLRGNKRKSVLSLVFPLCGSLCTFNIW
jgi:hypothetical protein